MIVQVDRRKESLPSFALPTSSVRLRRPPVRHRRNSSVVNSEAWLALLGMQHGRMVLPRSSFPLPLRIGVICNDGIVFVLMSQYRKGTYVRNQPQFDILSPLYSNPPVWPGAQFVHEHKGWEPKQIPRAGVEGLVGGDPMLADGNIIRRFVWVQRCLSWVAYGFLVSHHKRMPSVECRENCEASENYHLNVARHAFSCSMRFGALACPLCRRRIKFLDAFVLFLFGDVRFSNMGIEWGEYHLHLLFWVSSWSSLCDTFDVSHDAHGWRSMRIGVCEKGLVWWDVAILYAQCVLFVLDFVTLMTSPLVVMLRKGPFYLE